MDQDRADEVIVRTIPDPDGERSERASFWIALAVALTPIPVALLISWALGDPPWRPRPSPVDAGQVDPHPRTHDGPDRARPEPPAPARELRR